MKRTPLTMLALAALTLPRPAVASGPGFAAIQALCHKTLKMHGARATSPGLALGDGRFATVVRHHDRKKTRWELDLLLLRERDGVWSVTQRDALPLRGEAVSGNPETAAELCSIEHEPERAPAAALFVKDYDGDGKPELLVRWKLCWMLPGLGGTDVRVMRIYNLPAAGPLEPALHLEIEHDARPTTAGRTLGRYAFKDLSRDGHPDLEVRFTSSYVDYIKDVQHECTERWTRRFDWRAAGDRWVEAGPGKPRKLPRRCKRME
jgi:hypothetical protein